MISWCFSVQLATMSNGGNLEIEPHLITSSARIPTRVDIIQCHLHNSCRRPIQDSGLWLLLAVNDFTCTHPPMLKNVVDRWLVVDWPGRVGIKVITKIHFPQIFHIFIIEDQEEAREHVADIPFATTFRMVSDFFQRKMWLNLSTDVGSSIGTSGVAYRVDDHSYQSM